MESLNNATQGTMGNEAGKMGWGWTEKAPYVNANVFEMHPVDLWSPNGMRTPELHKMILEDSGRNY